jgi:hypothetical protein
LGGDLTKRKTKHRKGPVILVNDERRVKGRKRHILVDTFGLLIACRVEPADISDRKVAAAIED